ncbi:MAG: hypothetical protein M1840_006097 [Geoglossum simile]|nr:MAG: hypothetical protein M1840_006097 [Geoglossum simile]
MQSRGPASPDTGHGDETGGSISPDEFENAIADLLPLSAQDGGPAQKRPFKDSLFLRVTRLLELFGKHTWSMRPRTYIVLRMINRVDAMSGFVAEGLFDISLPYSQRTLPGVIINPTARLKFLELQRLVLSEQASTVEDGEGRHRHFMEDGDVHFKPIKRLGEGGFGEVDHVWSRLSYNEFARKRILRGRTFGKDKELVSGFERELDILKRLSHCHLVEYVGSYTDPRYVGLIMSPVADSDLAKYLGFDPFPTERLILLRQFYGCLVSALDYLHENKIRHKDIKPSNILVSGETIFITDFGTSLDWTDRGHSTTSGMRGAISRPYCSPEAFNSDPRNSSSDIYSLGCVFLEMTTVLRRQSLECMKQHFHSHGTSESYVRTNPDAVHSWLEKLRGEPSPDYDNQPFGWIKDMIRVRPESRPSAPELVSRISTCAGSFIGTCCTGDHGSADSSYQGSVPDQEATLVDQDPGGNHGPVIENRVDTPTKLAVDEKLQNLGVSTPSDSEISPLTQEQKTTQLLLENGYNINSVYLDHNAVLLWGSMMGHEAVVRLMLERGADPQVSGGDGVNALRVAASHGHIEVVRVLLAAGAYVNTHTPQGTALQAAAEGGHVGVVGVLLASKADVNAVRFLEASALQSAAARGHACLVELLLSAGADVENKHTSFPGRAALAGAAAGGHVEVLKILIAAKARIDSRSGGPRGTALQAAAGGGHVDAMHILLAAGANVNAAPGFRYSNTALQALQAAARAGHIKAMELLLAAEANVNAAPAGHWGRTALQAAARRGHTKAVRMLLDAKADVNAAASQQYGRTALQAAVEGGHIGIVEMLLAAGADVSAPMADAGGITALEAAEGNGNQQIIELLQSTLQSKQYIPPSKAPARSAEHYTPPPSFPPSGPVASSPLSAPSDAPPPPPVSSKWLVAPPALPLRGEKYARPAKRDKSPSFASPTGLVVSAPPPASSDAPPPPPMSSIWLVAPPTLPLRGEKYARPAKRDKSPSFASPTGLVVSAPPPASSDAPPPPPMSSIWLVAPPTLPLRGEKYARPAKRDKSPSFASPTGLVVSAPPPASSDAPPSPPASSNRVFESLPPPPRGEESTEKSKRSPLYLDEPDVQSVEVHMH